MTRRMNLLVLLALVTAGFSTDSQKKTLIIAVDESKPEESDAIISDLKVEEQSSSPTYRTSGRAYSPSIVQNAPINRQLGYILLSPEDFKSLQNINGVSVEKPKYLTYPVSAEIYDSSKADYVPTRNTYYPNSGYPTPIQTKYPSQPAPPLSSFSAHNDSQSNNAVLSGQDVSKKYESPAYNPSSKYSTDPASDGFLRNPTPNNNNKYDYGKYKSVNNYPSSKTFPYERSQEENGYHQKPNDTPAPHSSYVDTDGYHNSPNPEYYSKSTSSYLPYSNNQKDYNVPKTITYDPNYEAKYNYFDQPKSQHKQGSKHSSYTPTSEIYNGPSKSSAHQVLSPSYRTPPENSRESSIGVYDDKSKDTYDTTYRNPYPKDSYSPPSSYSEKRYPTHGGSYKDSSKPYTYNDEYLSKQNPFNSPTSYNTHSNTESFNGGRRKYKTSPKPYLYDAPKPSYDAAVEPNSYESPAPPHNAPNYHVSTYKDPYISTPYQRYPTSYDTREPHYKSKSASHDESTKHFHDSSLPEAYGSRYPEATHKEHLPNSEEKSYHWNPISAKPLSSYRQSSSPEILPQFYQSNNRSSYPSYSSDQYGSRHPEHYSYTDPSHPASYRAPEHTKLTPEDAKPSSYSNKKSARRPYNNSVRSSSPPYHHTYRDSLELADHHLAKKNYKPSRPAPLSDEYEQPRYPPLPPYSKSSTENPTYHGEYDDHSKENTGSYSSGESNYPPKSHFSGYTSNSYNPSYNQDKHQSYYPSSTEATPYYDHSSEEADVHIPRTYTKTVTKSYVMPPDDSSKESGYATDYSSETPYIPSSPKSSYNPINKKTRVSTADSSAYSRPYSYDGSPRSSDTYAPSKSNNRKHFKYYTRNDTLEAPPSMIRETLPPKRVEGVVYRSRKRYHDLPKVQKNRNYLPYMPKTYMPISGFDYKAYETAPKKNLTKVTSPKTALKFKYSPVSAKTSYGEETFAHDYEDYEDSSLAAIPGEAGKDYPILKEIPHTRFSCDNRAPGFYADIEHRCQVYYQCGDKGRIQSFLCPNGTIFNQATFVCEWWHNVDCANSEKYYNKNKELYKQNAPDKGKVKQSSHKKKKELRDYKAPVYYSDNHQGNEKVIDDEYTTTKGRGRKRSKITYV